MDALQAEIREEANNEGGGEGIARAYGINDLDGTAGQIRPKTAPLIKKATLVAPSEGNHTQFKTLTERFDLRLEPVWQVKHPGKHRQFLIVQLENVGEPKGLFNDLAVIKILAQIDVKNLEAFARGSGDELLDG